VCKHCINSEYHLGRDNLCTNIDKCIYTNYYFNSYNKINYFYSSILYWIFFRKK
jgi:hypothetical protein